MVQGASLVDCIKGGQIRLARELLRVYAQRVQQVPNLDAYHAIETNHPNVHLHLHSATLYWRC